MYLGSLHQRWANEVELQYHPLKVLRGRRNTLRYRAGRDQASPPADKIDRGRHVVED
jgi:hypothetical protein